MLQSIKSAMLLMKHTSKVKSLSKPIQLILVQSCSEKSIYKNLELASTIHIWALYDWMDILPHWVFSLQARFHSFTDGNILSVCDYEFVGKLFTNVFIDGIRLSASLSSVIPHSITISVKNTKKPFADGFTNEICAQKKSFTLEIYRRILFRQWYRDLLTATYCW